MMTEMTENDSLDALIAVTSAVPEHVAEIDAAWADPEYVAAMDTVRAVPVHPDGNASATLEQHIVNPTVNIDEELQAWIDPLSPTELAGLEASLLADGCRDPLVVWGSYLLDGHNRYALCTKHGIDYQTVEKTGLATKEDAKIWMIENQLGKRNTSDFTRVALALKLKPLVEQRAFARMVAGKADPTQNSAEGIGETRQAVAKAAGVSHDTVSKVEKIIEKAAPDVIAKVRAGELSINAAAKTVTPPKPAKPAAQEPEQPAPDAATPRVSPEQGEAAVTKLAALLIENAELRAEVADLKATVAHTLEDNEMMGRVFDADDQVKASMEEALRYRAVAEQANRALAGRSQEFTERARLVVRWKNRAEKAEKKLKALVAAGHP